jgi:light-regulated signal transduction histidine kinase (bacteriophytochrome)
MGASDLQRQLAEAQETIRALQEELAETNQGLLALTLELEQRVDERTKALRKAHEEVQRTNEELQKTNAEVLQSTLELQAANRELEAFSFSISHDLRAPLRVINGFSITLLEDYADRLDAEGQRLLQAIQRNAQRMNQLIDDLLAFSRVSRQEIAASEIAMEDLVRAILEEFSATMALDRIQFNIQPLPAARGDPAMIRQVLVNLLANAIKFTRNKAAPVIDIGAQVDASHTIYFIKDNGAGFDMRYADKLFGVFQRLHSEREFEGTGVGLAIVQRIIHRHGGRVWAEAKVGQGATFYFTLGGQAT